MSTLTTASAQSLVQQAQDMPGVAEAMRVYAGALQRMQSAATMKPAPVITTSNRTSR
jgi:hypothetical protein